MSLPKFDVDTHESHFWESFKASACGVAIPKSGHGYDKGGEFNISQGVTVIRATVSGTAGKLVEAYKRADVDDKAYLLEAGFTQNYEMDIPTIEGRGLVR